MARKKAGAAPAKTSASATPPERGVHAASMSSAKSSVKRAEARAPRASALLEITPFNVREILDDQIARKLA